MDIAQTLAGRSAAELHDGSFDATMKCFMAKIDQDMTKKAQRHSTTVKQTRICCQHDHFTRSGSEGS